MVNHSAADEAHAQDRWDQNEIIAQVHGEAVFVSHVDGCGDEFVLFG